MSLHNFYLTSTYKAIFIYFARAILILYKTLILMKGTSIIKTI